MICLYQPLAFLLEGGVPYYESVDYIFELLFENRKRLFNNCDWIKKIFVKTQFSVKFDELTRKNEQDLSDTNPWVTAFIKHFVV